MSTTVLEIVAASLQKINVTSDGEAPNAEQGVVGLSVLNDLLADWAADGVHLGWFPQTDLAAPAPLDDADVRGVKLCLATELAAHYGMDVSPVLAAEMDSAYTKIVKRTRPYMECDFSELPRAQNSWNGNWF